MKVLVLGYSVTAEKNSYVEFAARDIADPDIQLTKVGYGGLQPHHARFLFPAVIAKENPDTIILDQSTPPFRKFTKDLADYEKCVLSVVRECKDRGIRLAVLDLPRTDVDYSEDWVTECHKHIETAA